MNSCKQFLTENDENKEIHQPVGRTVLWEHSRFLSVGWASTGIPLSADPVTSSSKMKSHRVWCCSCGMGSVPRAHLPRCARDPNDTASVAVRRKPEFTGTTWQTRFKQNTAQTWRRVWAAAAAAGGGGCSPWVLLQKKRKFSPQWHHHHGNGAKITETAHGIKTSLAELRRVPNYLVSYKKPLWSCQSYLNNPC